MISSDAIVGYIYNSSPKALYLASYNSKPENEKLRIFNSSSSYENGILKLIFSRYVDDGYQPIDSRGKFNLIVATGDLSEGNMRKHNCRAQNSVEISAIEVNKTRSNNSENEGPVPLSEYQKKAIAHGTFMFTAFTIIFPTGIIISRIRQLIHKDIIYFHFVTQGIGFVFVTVATILAYEMVTVHFASGFHGIYGTIAIILVWIQVLSGVLRPHIEKSQPVTRRRKIWQHFHFFLGYTLFFVSIPNVCVGVIILGGPPWVLGIYAPIAFLIGSVLIFAEVRKFI